MSKINCFEPSAFSLQPSDFLFSPKLSKIKDNLFFCSDSIRTKWTLFLFTNYTNYTELFFFGQQLSTIKDNLLCCGGVFSRSCHTNNPLITH